jgi:ferredoxin-NADP reductase
MTLVYVNENIESTAYLNELEMYAKETDRFRLIASMLHDQTWAGEKRGVNAEFLKEYFPQIDKHRFFVTGPVQYVPAAFKQIKDAGVPIQNLTMEIFTGY